MFEGANEPVVIALMEAYGWFIEDVEDALEAGADLGGEADALSFAAGEGVGGTAEFEVIEADVVHKSYTGFDFFDDGAGDEFFGLGEFEVAG